MNTSADDGPDAGWVAELLPRARQMATDSGGPPSRNRLMRELRIGAAKARTLRETLSREQSTPDPPDPADSADEHAGPAGGQPGPTLDPPGSAGGGAAGRPVRSWPVLVLAAPAWVAIWSGWVGLGQLTGFGTVHLLPGIVDDLVINTAITLPVGVETYAAYALRAWLSPQAPTRARRFAKWSAIGSLLLGAAGQVAYHLMVAAGMRSAPWPVTTLVSCLPVAVLGMGAALAHLLRTDHDPTARYTR